MSAYTDPKTGASNLSSDFSADGERALWWAEFDGRSEEDVRNRIARNLYDDRVAEFARQWLINHDVLRWRDEIRALRSLVNQAKSGGSEYNRLALRADETARHAEEAARSAEVTARVAVEQAMGAIAEARAARKLTLTVATIALGIVIAEVLVRILLFVLPDIIKF